MALSPTLRRPALWLALIVLLAGLPAGAVAAPAPQPTQPYAIHEWSLASDDNPHSPRIAGNVATWLAYTTPQDIFWHDLAAGQTHSLRSANPTVQYALGGGWIATTEQTADGRYGVFGYRLPEGTRSVVADFAAAGINRGAPATDGATVVWRENSGDTWAIWAGHPGAGNPGSIRVDKAFVDNPAVSGRYVVWMDSRHAASPGQAWDIYAYDFDAGREVRLSSRTENVGAPAISGSRVVWTIFRDSAYRIMLYDFATGQETTLLDLAPAEHTGGIAIDGDIVVWSSRAGQSFDIFGYDLTLRQRFIVSRAAGEQASPSISGKTVVWQDMRASGAGRYEYQSAIYAARLDPGPAEPPPVAGSLDRVDAKIEVVWPKSGRPGTDTDLANIEAWLFEPGTLNLAPCQWDPAVQLWAARNNEPARLVALGQRSNRYAGVGVIPTWQFNDVDVRAARDRSNKIFFFLTTAGAASRSNVWAHADDPRTFFPQQDVPAGIGSVSDTVDAKIEIVWPHGGAPVAGAERVNVSAMLFQPGTLLSVPADFPYGVRLWRSLNNGVGEEVGNTNRRLVTQHGVTFPVWDFDNVDVSAARDPANKYYFRLTVDEMTAHSNVWTHGADARTYFPQVDEPAAGCR